MNSSFSFLEILTILLFACTLSGIAAVGVYYGIIYWALSTKYEAEERYQKRSIEKYIKQKRDEELERRFMRALHTGAAHHRWWWRCMWGTLTGNYKTPEPQPPRAVKRIEDDDIF